MNKDPFHLNHSLFYKLTHFGSLSVSASIAKLNIKWSLSKGRHRVEFIKLLETNTLAYFVQSISDGEKKLSTDTRFNIWKMIKYIIHLQH